MNFDVSYVWPGACIGWFLVTVVLTARNWKKLLASIIAWVVCIDVFAILGSVITPLLRHSAHSQAIGSVILGLPYAALLWLLIRLLSRDGGWRDRSRVDGQRPAGMNDLDDKLKWAAERAIGAPVAFAANVPIVETFRGQIVWEGVVSDFTAEDSRHVYAWAVESDQGPGYLAVVQEPPIKSALDAVRAWLVSQARK